MKLFDRIANWLIAKAHKTPYWHLPNYMRRFHLVPMKDAGSASQNGCGPVSFWKRPFAWVCQRFDIAVRLHEIISSDDRGKGYHDHPWPYISIILKGGYFEHTPRFESGIYVGDDMKWYGPGSILFRKANSWHSLQLASHRIFTMGGYPGKPEFDHIDHIEHSATTLFITFKYRQKWGFLVNPHGKKYYRDVFAEAAAKLPEIK